MQYFYNNAPTGFILERYVQKTCNYVHPNIPPSNVFFFPPKIVSNEKKKNKNLSDSI